MVPSDIGPLLRWLPVAALVALAVFFGRTLAPGRMPLIERIARVGLPEMPASLQQYTRGLTALWCAWFVLAALALAWLQPGVGLGGVLAWAGTVALFVGEYLLRPFFFPGMRFPRLVQQLRDTWRAWRPPA